MAERSTSRASHRERRRHPSFFVSRLHEGTWSPPEKAVLPDGVAPARISFSPDGTRLYFTHLPDASGHSRLWAAEPNGSDWKNARPVGGDFEQWDADHISPSATSDGTLYFVSNRREHAGGWGIYRSTPRDGAYQEPVLVGGGLYTGISTLLHEISVAASPDGSFLVFSSVAAPNGFGGADLYLAEFPTAEQGRARA